MCIEEKTITKIAVLEEQIEREIKERREVLSNLAKINDSLFVLLMRDEIKKMMEK